MDDRDYTPHRRRADTRGASDRSRERSYGSSANDGTQRTRRLSAYDDGYQQPQRTRRYSSYDDDYYYQQTSRTRRSAAHDDDFPQTQRVRRTSASSQGQSRESQSSTSSGRRTRSQQYDQPSTRQTSVRRSVAQSRADTQAQRASSQRTTSQRSSSQRTASQYDGRTYSSRRRTSGASSPSPKKSPSKKTIIIGAVAAVIVLALIGVFAYVNSISGNLHAGVTQDLRAALVETDMAKEPFYMLLMGTDGSADRDQDEEYMGGEYRSDSIMLARIDAPNKKVTLLSIHRDTRVDLGEYGVQKLNAARSNGGPALAVQTVANLAGVDISHYAEINFDAFRAIVDAIGGVEVDVPVDIDDSDAGGSLRAGLQTLDGEQALILCRSRNTYSMVAGDPDQMRAANQRLVLSAIAKKLLASDVATIAKTVRDVSGYVTTDLELNDIIGLAQAFQGLDPESDIYTAMQPADAVYEDAIWWSVTEEPAWTEMMNRVKQGLPPVEGTKIDEQTGTVLATAGNGEVIEDEKTAWINVKNGTPRDGLAYEAMLVLNNAGFVNIAIGSANVDTYTETVIVYKDPAQFYEANQIYEALGQGRVMLNDGDYIFDGNFLVLIGSDWK